MTNAKPSAGIFIMTTEEELFKGKLKYGECDGCSIDCREVGTDMHICPFAEDIHGDSNEICNCCTECTNQCAMDI